MEKEYEDAKNIMQVSVLEAHDRLLHLFKTMSDTISQGAEDCLKKNPDSLMLQKKFPYVYIYGHARTLEDSATKKILWQPRLTKPKPEPNSFLFRAKSNTDNVEVVWILPTQELWDQFDKSLVTESHIVRESIWKYKNRFEEMSKPDPRDLSDEAARRIYIDCLTEMCQEFKKLSLKTEVSDGREEF